MSDRASASLPSNCSGAMYWNVPTMVPSTVSQFERVGVPALALAINAACTGLAKPKSINFAPDFQHDVAWLQVAMDVAHPSRAERRLNLVGSEFRTRGEGHNARIIAPISETHLRNSVSACMALIVMPPGEKFDPKVTAC